jgi:queuine tRNA-ribosyltransferase
MLDTNQKNHFELLHQSKKSNARVGRIHTPHGIIDTPGFVAVGTNGTLKCLDNALVDQMKQQLMFCNTYHLLLQPGPDLVEKAGGLHKFIGRSQPIITDSGGFQVFSLAYGGVADELKSRGKKKQEGRVLKINEEGVLFSSYRDGSRLLLTPESSIHAQKAFGADIIIPLDELPPYHIGPEALRKSLDRTHRWEERSLAVHLADRRQQMMYAVIHGGIDEAMRAESVRVLTEMPFDGFAIGGSLGKNREEMIELLKFVMPRLPKEKPNHLLGIGDLPSITKILPLGIDTFDSSYPTKAARHGLLYTKQGDLKIGRRVHAEIFQPIEADCPCHTCQNFTLSYLHHLFKAHEPVAATLASVHNVQYMVDLMARYRLAILDDQI